MTLDQWTANQQIKPDFIKCDVEGAELLVFRGGQETLRRDQPIVFAELLRKWSKPFGYHPNDMLCLFRGLGYLCYAVGSKGVHRIENVARKRWKQIMHSSIPKPIGRLIAALEALK